MLPATRLPAERHIFSVIAAVTLVRREVVQDLHLVLESGADHMIAESPSVPACTVNATRYRRRQMADARKAVGLCSEARIVGVAFWDFKHGQTGVAPNAIELSDLEPPIGTERLEEFIDEEWGERASRTRAKNISILKGFFEWAVLRGKLHGDPARPIRPPKKRGVERTTFSEDQERAIFAQNDRRDRLALHLLLKAGIRKGALQGVQFRHVDHAQKRLTVFTKGGKVQTVPVVDPAFWNELERYILDWGAQAHEYLLCREHTIPRWDSQERKTKKLPPDRIDRFQYRDQPMGVHGLHKWWYRCLERAGVVAKGQTSGERMHKARHTAGQRVLDATHGNLKAVQKLLGHSSISTAGDIYTDWDIDQLTETLRGMLEETEGESFPPSPPEIPC